MRKNVIVDEGGDHAGSFLSVNKVESKNLRGYVVAVLMDVLIWLAQKGSYHWETDWVR